MPVDAVSETFTRAARARTRADARLLGAIDDLFLPDDARLSERTRLGLARLLSETIGGVETALRRQAARLLAAKGMTANAEALLEGRGGTERLMAAGLLRDEGLIEALLARVQYREIADALPVAVGTQHEMSLLVRLAAVPDRVIAGAARALLVADSGEGLILPAALQHRLVWMVAAAVRPVADDLDLDRAIAEAAWRALDAHDESEAADAAAMRLAAAIDARPDELRPLLLEALGDRRLSLSWRCWPMPPVSTSRRCRRWCSNRRANGCG